MFFSVLESEWPSENAISSQLRWNRLKNVVFGAAHFRRAGKKFASRRRLSVSCDNNLSTLETVDGASRTSLDSGNLANENQQQQNGSSSFLDFAAFDRIRDRLGSIVKSSSTAPQESSEDMVSSAGLLISTGESTNSSIESARFSNKNGTNANQHDLSPRVISKSDSFAGDSKFIDKLQKQYDSKLKCQKALKFGEIEEGEEHSNGILSNGESEEEKKRNGDLLNALSKPSPTK